MAPNDYLPTQSSVQITPPQPSEGTRRNRRAEMACTICRDRKVKCLQSSPLATCVRCREHNLQCTYKKVADHEWGRSQSPESNPCQFDHPNVTLSEPHMQAPSPPGGRSPNLMTPPPPTYYTAPLSRQGSQGYQHAPGSSPAQPATASREPSQWLAAFASQPAYADGTYSQHTGHRASPSHFPPSDPQAYPHIIPASAQNAYPNSHTPGAPPAGHMHMPFSEAIQVPPSLQSDNRQFDLRPPYALVQSDSFDQQRDSRPRAGLGFEPLPHWDNGNQHAVIQGRQELGGDPNSSHSMIYRGASHSHQPYPQGSRR